jgi:hypothetical protein
MELVCHLRRVNPTNRWRGEIDRNPTICCISLKTQQYNYILYQPALILGYINFGNRPRSFASDESSDIVKKTKTIFWISSQFAIYRIGLWLISEPEPCKCFGDVFRWIGASDDFIRAVTIVSLLYMLIPSGVFWVFGLTKVFKNKSGGTA